MAHHHSIAYKYAEIRRCAKTTRVLRYKGGTWQGHTEPAISQKTAITLRSLSSAPDRLG
jgi:hypothetical protein